MAKSPAGSGSTPNGAGAASAGTAARSKVSRKSASVPRSKGSALSDGDLFDIFASDIKRLEERFGEIFFIREAGDEPVLVVLPKTLDVDSSGLIVLRKKALAEI